MSYALDSTLIKEINFLRLQIESLIEKNNGDITKETINLSQKLDKYIVLYYQHKYIK